MDTIIAKPEAAPRARSFSRACRHCEDVASGVKTQQVFLRGIAYNIRWAPVSRETRDFMRFQNTTISDKTRREFEHYCVSDLNNCCVCVARKRD